MAKVLLVMLLLVITISAQEFPFQNNQLAAAAQSGNWDKFRELLTQNVGFNNWPSPISGDVKSLRSSPDTHVFGQSSSSFKSSSNINGQRSEFSAGHQVINNDGEILEYDFKP